MRDIKTVSMKEFQELVAKAAASPGLSSITIRRGSGLMDDSPRTTYTIAVKTFCWERPDGLFVTKEESRTVAITCEELNQYMEPCE